MDGIVLELRNVSKVYGGVVALRNVDLDINEGEIHGLVGENGSGKSTLVKIVTGVIEPEPGALIRVNDEEFSKLPPILSLRKGIHVVHQDLSLFPNLSVAENIAVHEYVLGRGGLVSWKNIKEKARKALEIMGLDLDLDTEVGALPLADQQLVAICRAIASEAKIVILDEPTAALTSKEVERLFSHLRNLKRHGVSVIFISHRLDEVLDISDRITVLKDGVKVGTYRSEELDKKKLTYLMTGKELKLGKKGGRRLEGDVILEVEGLTKEGQFEDISFKLRKGEILGIIGPRGAGRTELALAIFGMNPPDRGTVKLEGEEIRVHSSRDAIEHGIAYVPENRLTQGLVLDQPVSYNVVITLLEKIVSRILIDKLKMKSIVKKAVDTFGIKVSDVELPVRTLSGGNQQKVVLAKWILRSPKVLILDGPTIGIDVAAKESIYELVREYSERGVGIIFISDEASEVLMNSDRILLMKNGKIVDEYNPDEIDEATLDSMIKGSKE